MAWQIVAAWHGHGYWIGDIKPSNFVFDHAKFGHDNSDASASLGRDGGASVVSTSPRVYLIDVETAVCFCASVRLKYRVCCILW